MGRQRSLRSKAAHFLSDLTTVILNPISDKPSWKSHPPAADNENDTKGSVSQLEPITEESSEGFVDGPDTSSFAAFLYSLLSSSEGGDDPNAEEKTDNQGEKDEGEVSSNESMGENSGKKSLISRGRQSLGRALIQATKTVGFRYQERRNGLDVMPDDISEPRFSGVEMRDLQSSQQESESLMRLPEISEPSMLLSEKARTVLYLSLPSLVQGRKWLLLYSTWRHGISLSTLYRRSLLLPGQSLLVVGDRKGAVFGGLVEAPLRPTNQKKYQGTNSTFVFTTASGQPDIFRPTGANRYFTLCSHDFLAIGGGSHFAIYLDNDLLNGSSSSSETYGNPCLACSQDFEVKEVELWGFVYSSKYEEVLSMSRTTEATGICRW